MDNTGRKQKKIINDNNETRVPIQITSAYIIPMDLESFMSVSMKKMQCAITSDFADKIHSRVFLKCITFNITIGLIEVLIENISTDFYTISNLNYTPLFPENN